MQGERARSYLVLDSGLLIQPDKKSSKKPNIFESREYQDPFWHRCHSLGVLAEAGAGAGGPPHMAGGYAEPWSLGPSAEQEQQQHNISQPAQQKRKSENNSRI